jgi:outer membrane receptor protein involved in Fe transport
MELKASKLAAALICAAVMMPLHGAVIEEVVVTAQKREQNPQDVGIAINALTGEQMSQLGYTNAQQVTAMAAGVHTVQPNGEANYSIAIRGVPTVLTVTGCTDQGNTTVNCPRSGGIQVSVRSCFGTIENPKHTFLSSQLR